MENLMTNLEKRGLWPSRERLRETLARTFEGGALETEDVCYCAAAACAAEYAAARDLQHGRATLAQIEGAADALEWPVIMVRSHLLYGQGGGATMVALAEMLASLYDARLELAVPIVYRPDDAQRGPGILAVFRLPTGRLHACPATWMSRLGCALHHGLDLRRIAQDGSGYANLWDWRIASAGDVDRLRALVALEKE